MQIIEVDSTCINMNINIYSDTYDIRCCIQYSPGVFGVKIENVGAQQREPDKNYVCRAASSKANRTASQSQHHECYVHLPRPLFG